MSHGIKIGTWQYELHSASAGARTYDSRCAPVLGRWCDYAGILHSCRICHRQGWQKVFNRSDVAAQLTAHEVHGRRRHTVINSLASFILNVSNSNTYSTTFIYKSYHYLQTQRLWCAILRYYRLYCPIGKDHDTGSQYFRLHTIRRSLMAVT